MLIYEGGKVMKVKFRGIIFDELTIEKTNAEVIDIAKINEAINLTNIHMAWGYICKDCMDKHKLEIDDLRGCLNGSELEGMICYSDNCSSFNNVYEFALNDDEIKELEFIIQ
jgi:hypothetical protein